MEVFGGFGEPDTDPIARFLTTYKLPLLFGGCSILLVVISLTLLLKSLQPATPIEFIQATASTSATVQSLKIKADIEGAVVKPGLYELEKGSRIEDLLVAAGGLKGDADMSFVEQKINRAALLSDGAKLYIPRLGELETSHNLSPLLQRSVGSSQNAIVSINFASQFQLESLPGVGPATAAKIIAGRPYQTLQELVVKKAVGKSVFEKIKDMISL